MSAADGVFLTDIWLPSIEHTVKPGMFESYRRNVRLHVAGRAIGHRQLQRVDRADLNGLYATLMRRHQEHRPLSARSVAYVATILHRAFRDAVRWQALVGNPADAANPPRPGARPEMQTWTGGQLLTLLNHVAANRLSGAWWLLAVGCWLLAVRNDGHAAGGGARPAVVRRGPRRGACASHGR